MAVEGIGALYTAFTGAAATGTAATAVTAVGTAIDVGAAAYGASAMSKKPAMPPSPLIQQSQIDQQVQQSENEARNRQAIAGGVNSTIGTAGGQAGSMLNPSTMQQKTLLGQ